jgi:hypothetical protein
MTPNNPDTYFAMIIYTDHDGAEHSISALVLAVDPEDAMHAAIEAVLALPNCASIVGGMIEAAPNAQEAPQDNVRPAGASLH